LNQRSQRKTMSSKTELLLNLRKIAKPVAGIAAFAFVAAAGVSFYKNDRPDSSSSTVSSKMKDNKPITCK